MDKRLRLTPKQKKVVNHFKDVLKQLLDEDIRIIQEYTIDDAIYGRFDRLSFINFKNVIDCEVWDDDGEEYYDDEREDMEWYAPPINELKGISVSSDFDSNHGVCIPDNENEDFALVLKNPNYKPLTSYIPQEMYEGMPVIEASNQMNLIKKLEVMTERPSKYALRISSDVGFIKDREFYFNDEIAAVFIPDSVKKIGNGAFKRCFNLTSVTIPDSVSKIGNNAFEGCLCLKNIVLGNSLKEIGNSAFKNCLNLTSVIIPDSVSKIGNNAFHMCYKLKNIVLGNSVTEIGNGAFKSCMDLTSVTIPDSVSKIGNNAFDCWTELNKTRRQKKK